MIAIVKFKEANIVSIISILISMISVATKSMVINIAIEYKTFIFNWLSMVTDFFGIFFAISWVWYHPQSDDTFTIIGYIWLCKLTFLVLPFVYFTGVSMFFGFVRKFHNRGMEDIRYKFVRDPTICERTCSILSTSIVIGILHFIGLALGTMVVEIGCLSYMAWINWFFVTDPVEHDTDHAVMFWGKLFDWLGKAKGRQDLVLRISCIWYMRDKDKSIFSSSYWSDAEFMKYLEEKLSTNKYEEITLNDLKINTSQTGDVYDRRFFWDTIKTQYLHPAKQVRKDKWKGDIIDSIVNKNDIGCMKKTFRSVTHSSFWGYLAALAETYYFVPCYLLSRCVNILFPVIIISYLAITDNWSQIDLFQYVMLGIYWFLFLIWCLFAYMALKRSFWIFHLSLGNGFRVNKSGKRRYNGSLMMMQSLYDEIKEVPKRRKVVLDILGAHIGSVVLSFLSDSVEIKTYEQLRQLRRMRKQRLKLQQKSKVK